MSAAANKALMQRIFEGLAKGDGTLFGESLADNFTWRLIGTTAWSRDYVGKEVVQRELFKPLFAQFGGRYTNTATRFIGEGDMVVVECRGNVITKSHKPYNNTYCWVIRFENGKLAELTEYMDTELVAKALAPPS